MIQHTSAMKIVGKIANATKNTNCNECPFAPISLYNVNLLGQYREVSQPTHQYISHSMVSFSFSLKMLRTSTVGGTEKNASLDFASVSSTTSVMMGDGAAAQRRALLPHQNRPLTHSLSKEEG